MFRPPRCPHLGCPNHLDPNPRAFRPHGSYRALCRPHPIPRFRCSNCLRTFSRQTFRMDYRDHRPDLNARLFQSLASGLGLRQTSRNLRLSLRCTELKFRKIARHLRRLNLNLRRALPEGATLQLDELETYEGRRNTRPLSVPVLIEARTRFVIWAESAAIRPRGKMTPARGRAMAEDEKRFGRRRDRSRRSLRRTLGRGADLVGGLHRLHFQTDMKSSYVPLAREAFGKARLVHSQTSGRLPRAVANPLFPINHTEAMARDLTGRLRRESWLVSKKRRFLDLGLQIFLAYRNYVRRRFNFDRQSPAQMLGFAPRRLEETELLSWRQDWAGRSIHPLASRQESVEERMDRASPGWQ
jgi:transposase-like protein